MDAIKNLIESLRVFHLELKEEAEKVKPVLELTNFEADNELTELLDDHWHVYVGSQEENPECWKCNEKGVVNKYYATSYDAIIPVISNLDVKNKDEMDRDQFDWFFQHLAGQAGYKAVTTGSKGMYVMARRTPRELTNAVIEVLRGE